jgi:hypothetical protein
MKTFIKFIISVAVLICLNITYFTFIGQWQADKHLKAENKLNLYEVVSTHMMHFALCSIGYLVEPEVAKFCTCKHLHLNPKKHIKRLACDDYVREKMRHIAKDNKEITLTWDNYDSKAALLLNGTKLSCKQLTDTEYLYRFKIANSYYPSGYPKVNNIKFSEALFHYLETKGILLDIPLELNIIVSSEFLQTDFNYIKL